MCSLIYFVIHIVLFVVLPRLKLSPGWIFFHIFICSWLILNMCLNLILIMITDPGSTTQALPLSTSIIISSVDDHDLSHHFLRCLRTKVEVDIDVREYIDSPNAFRSNRFGLSQEGPYEVKFRQIRTIF